MAQIPIGSFGQVMPNVAPGRVIPTGGEQVGNALANLATPLQQYSAQLKQEEQEQANLQQKDDDFNFAIRASEYGIDMSELQTSMKSKVANGELTDGEAQAQYKERATIIGKEYEEKIPMSTKNQFTLLQARTHGNDLPAYTPIYEGVKRTDSISRLGLAVDNAYRIDDPEQRKATVYSMIDSNPYLTDTEKMTQKITFDRREISNVFKSTLEAASFNNDEEGVTTIKEEALKNKDLTPEQQNSLVASANNELARIQRAKEQQAKAIEQEAKVAYTEAKQVLDTGFPVSEEQRESMKASVAGSPLLSQELEADLYVSDTLQQYKTLSVTEQNKFAMKLRTDLNKTGSSDAVRAAKLLGAIETYSNQNSKLANENPMEAIQRQTGVVYYTPDRDSIKSGQIDPTQARKSALAIKDKNKSDPAYSLNYLSKDTMDAIKDDYELGDTKAKARILNSLNTVGGGDADVTHAIYSDMFGAKDATKYRAATYYLNSKNKTTQAGAKNILSGIKLLSDGDAKSVLPKEKELQAAFLSTGRYASLTSQEAKGKYEIQKAYYISKMSEQPDVPRDKTTGEAKFNKEIWNQGNIVVNEGADITMKYSSGYTSTITKPAHLTDSEFKERLYNNAMKVVGEYDNIKTTNDYKAYADYRKDLRAYRVIETKTSGVYVFQKADGTILKSKKGLPIYSNVLPAK